MFVKIFPCGPLQTNAILVGCLEKKIAAAIDPSQGSLRLLLQEAEANGLQIGKILLTHSHWDHIADAAALQEATHAAVYVHTEDAKNMLEPGSDGLGLYFPIKGVSRVEHLADGQIVQVGNLELKVIHSPGHTPGGVCFYIESEQTLIAGDTLFRGSYGRVDLPTGELERMQHTLAKLKTLPPETKVICGHGPVTTILKELRSQSWDL